MKTADNAEALSTPTPTPFIRAWEVSMPLTYELKPWIVSHLKKEKNVKGR